MITMNIDQHTYTHQFNGKYVSVSKIKESIKQPFDRDYWLEYKALELLIPNLKKLHAPNPKPPLAKYRAYVSDTEFNAARQTVEIEWEAKKMVGISRGHNYHDMKEAKAARDTKVLCPYDGKWYYTKDPHDLTTEYKRSLLTSLDELEVGCCYPEIMIWNDAYYYAGTSDKLFKLSKTKHFILDYKTDRKFTTENRWRNLLHPVSKLQETELNVYGIQLGLYALPFHQLGLEVVGCELHHNFMGIEKVYPVPVMIKEAEAVASYYYYSHKS